MEEGREETFIYLENLMSYFFLIPGIIIFSHSFTILTSVAYSRSSKICFCRRCYINAKYYCEINEDTNCIKCTKYIQNTLWHYSMVDF